MLHHGNRLVTTLRSGGRQLSLLMHGNRQIYPAKKWSKPQLLMRISDDATGKWFEVGMRLPCTVPGSAAAGWDLLGIPLRLQCSTDLVTFTTGEFEDCAGSPATNGDGSKTYWARCSVPLYWKNTLVDLTATTARHGKSITDLKVGTVTVALSYPYAMPADAARLQADLRAAGYPGAVVSNVPAALSVEVIRHYYASNSYNRVPLAVTFSGGNVTMVKTVTGTNISLPYPYAMPAQAATLQADLRTAGQTGATVRLFADAWTIFLPDRPAAGMNQRLFSITFTPADPHPEWDMFGTSLGDVPDNTVTGTHGNVRSAGGTPRNEAGKQFFRY